MAPTLTVGGSTLDLGKVTDERSSLVNNIIVLSFVKKAEEGSATADNEVIDIMGVTNVITVSGYLVGTTAEIQAKLFKLIYWCNNKDNTNQLIEGTYISDFVKKISTSTDTTGTSVNVTPQLFDYSYTADSPTYVSYSLTMTEGKNILTYND